MAKSPKWLANTSPMIATAQWLPLRSGRSTSKSPPSTTGRSSRLRAWCKTTRRTPLTPSWPSAMASLTAYAVGTSTLPGPQLPAGELCLLQSLRLAQRRHRRELFHPRAQRPATLHHHRRQRHLVERQPYRASFGDRGRRLHSLARRGFWLLSDRGAQLRGCERRDRPPGGDRRGQLYRHERGGDQVHRARRGLSGSTG